MTAARIPSIIAALASLLLGSGAGAQCHYTVTYKIATVACPWPWEPEGLLPGDVVADSTWVGMRAKCAPDDQEYIPLRWSPETGMQVIPTPASVTSAYPRGTNAAGMVVGAFKEQIDLEQACVWMPDGEFIVLPQLPDQWTSTAQAVNSSGMAVGYRITIKGKVQPFIWHDGKLIEIKIPDEFGGVGQAECVSDSGFVAGSAGDTHCIRRAFRWSLQDGMEILPPLPGCIGSTAVLQGVTNDGTVLGRSTLPGAQPCQSSGSTIPTLWRRHEPEEVVPLEGYARVGASDINNKGVIIGRCLGPAPPPPSSIPPMPTLWYGGVPCSFRDLVIDGSIVELGPNELALYHINDQGQILASAPVPIQTWEGVVDAPGIWIFTPVEAPMGDLNGDCQVDGSDLAALLGQWGPRKFSVADIDGSGEVDGTDLNVLLEDWTFSSMR